MATLGKVAAVFSQVGSPLPGNVEISASRNQPALARSSLITPMVLAQKRFMGSPVVVKTASTKKVASRAIFVAAVASLAGAKNDLAIEAEQRWLRAHNEPLEGVNFTYEEFQEALSKYDFNFEVGDTVKGVVFKADHGGFLIDIGAKASAFLPIAESCIYKVKGMDEVGLYEGMEEDFRIIRDDDDRGRMIVSLRKIQYDMAWERCRQCLADDVTVRGRVLLSNRGGLLVQAEGLRGFVPTSHIALRTPKEELVMKEIPLKFLEVEEDRTRLVLSNRKAMTEHQQTMFAVGDVVVGVVQSVKPYGAFVDLGGANGLLHISQISHDRITNVETVLSEGDQLKVMILSQDRDRGRISLSTKKLEPTPGDMLRNPALVFEKADEMARTFRERVAAAEAAARAEELRLQQEVFPMTLWNTPEASPEIDDPLNLSE